MLHSCFFGLGPECSSCEPASIFNCPIFNNNVCILLCNLFSQFINIFDRAAAFLIAMSPPLYFAYYVSYLPLTWVLEALLPGSLASHFWVTIDTTFIVSFFILDQLLCIGCTVYTTDGKSKSRSWKELLSSFWYGFLNCKTFFLVLLFSVHGFKVYSPYPTNLSCRKSPT